MKIALDFDNTYSLDPDFWDTFIETSQICGHDIMIVTGRREGVYPEDFNHFNIPVYKTKWLAKRAYMREIEGMEIDVWIDDCPEAILTNCEGKPKVHTYRDSTNAS
jgi:hypothetical protein